MTIQALLPAALLAAVSLQEALDHLASVSPATDLVPAWEEVLGRNAELALYARDVLPWGPTVPDSIFLRYVLPVRVSQEPLSDWRPVLFEELMPLAASAPSMEEAAVRVLAWCDSLTEFRQTQARDQSPLVTLACGSGRCEELTILQMSALRAVGIPCRQVYTPWWTVCDNNHAWTEIWTPEGWVCSESGAAVDSLDQPTWFEANASRAAVVFAIAQDSVPRAWLHRGSASLLNVTRTYAATGTLSLPPGFNENVHVCIVNWGAPRPVARMGRTSRSLELGGGVYLLTWGWPLRSAVLEVVPGGTVVLDPAAGEDIPAGALLNLEDLP
jgi:hypothetical protein